MSPKLAIKSEGRDVDHMMFKTKMPGSFFYQIFTLKRRIIVTFAVSALIPFACITLVSYYAISSILTNKMQSGIQSNLKQVQLSLENTIANLNHVSQQLAFQGSVGKKLEQYLTTDQPFERSKLMDDMRTELSLITFTNPNVGLTMYFLQDDNIYMLENSGIKDGFSPERLPLLAEYYRITYYGPHISNDRFNNQYVLSALRKVDLPERDDVYVYIESSFKLTQNILDSDRIGKNSFHFIVDNNGRIAYSEVPDVFPVNTQFQGGGPKSTSGLLNDYYWYKATSNQGWSVVSVISKVEYNKEIDRWIDQMVLLFMLFLLLSLILALLLWKMVYIPLNKFNKEIKWIEQGNFHSESARTKIPEFDYLLDQFQRMKKQILDLFAEVERKEKRRADLEIEKLRYQINPHFLMNTLNSVHWLAVTNGQSDIDRVVLSLNKLLFYNLSKMGQSTTIQEEIDALKEYLVLQQIRYDFHYDVQIHADEHVMKMSIPRFILQPLVENAIYHGLSDDGYIRVDVKLAEQIEISIHDNGSGMSEETIQNLLNKEQVEHEKVGMGIGLNYVKRMLESYYEGKAKLEIKSVIGKGTNVFLSLPVPEVDPKHD